jgi:hypothetical protein
MNETQIAKLKTIHGDYRIDWPDAIFAPWDAPPIGMRVRRGNMTGKVIGIDDREELPDRVHGECLSCSCPNLNPCFGWWKIESEQYMKDGKPQVLLEYPPAWVPAETSRSLIN